MMIIIIIKEIGTVYKCSISKQADRSNSYLSQGKGQQRLNPTNKNNIFQKKKITENEVSNGLILWPRKH